MSLGAGAFAGPDHVSTLYAWAARHAIPAAALADLRALMGLGPALPDAKTGSSEAAVQSRVRLAAARAGIRTWRNNVGALRDDRGVPVRYGLANENAAMNARYKSSDLIGCTPVAITPNHVGATLGVFTAWECKPAGWTYAGTKREAAQLAFLQLVIADGGIGRFVTDEGDIR